MPWKVIACRGRQICLGANNDIDGASRPIRLTISENFVSAKANMEFDRIYGPMKGLECLFASF